MDDYRVNRGEVQEDQFTAAIENRTAQVPSSAFLAMALGSMALSAALKGWNKNHASLFVGQWAAPFLLLGIYNKMVKQHGSDGRSWERGRGTQKAGSYSDSGETSYGSAERTYSQSSGI